MSRHGFTGAFSQRVSRWMEATTTSFFYCQISVAEPFPSLVNLKEVAALTTKLIRFDFFIWLQFTFRNFVHILYGEYLKKERIVNKEKIRSKLKCVVFWYMRYSNEGLECIERLTRSDRYNTFNKDKIHLMQLQTNYDELKSLQWLNKQKLQWRQLYFPS